MGWQPYHLDHAAQNLVLDHRDKENVLNESHKMRMAVAYGLERFWGEHLRYERENSNESRNKGSYWKAVWCALADLLKPSGIQLPDPEGRVAFNNTDNIKKIATEIWQMPLDQQRVALAVLSQLCDSLVWWTQRYKKQTSKANE
ncbi:MAG: hypothetical protein HC816_21735 [Leptolyngbyaceae cyanobacterium RM1_1_2]|nr:hypothetical protein [Leptolyngbyaceae cyanobacterium RM1_1_2]